MYLEADTFPFTMIAAHTDGHQALRPADMATAVRLSARR